MDDFSWITEGKWKALSSEVFTKVLTFLPIACTCQLRTVCKKWNRLIGHRNFALSYAEVSPEEYVLITVRRDRVLVPRRWDLTDVAKKRFFTISDDFLTNYVRRQVGITALVANFKERITLAADGGFFFIAYSTGSMNGSLLFMCNPVLKTAQQIPHLKFNWHFVREWDSQREQEFRGPKVVMSTNRFSMDYDIYVFDTSDRLHIYESTTTRWREPLDIPQGISRHSASVFINRKLHVLFHHSDLLNDRLKKGIFSFDKLTGVWLDCGVELPGLTKPELWDIPPAGDTHLVLSGEHLFYVLVDSHDPSELKFQVFDVILSRRECMRITEMPWFCMTR